MQDAGPTIMRLLGDDVMSNFLCDDFQSEAHPIVTTKVDVIHEFRKAVILKLF